MQTLDSEVSVLGCDANLWQTELKTESFTVKGTVRLTKEGEIRWTSFSIFHGQERWRSEGIQIGGLRSARGVIGSWFDR